MCSQHDTHLRLHISPLREHETLHFDNESDVHTSPKNYEESGYDLDLDLQTILVAIVCSISYEKWANWKK